MATRSSRTIPWMSTASPGKMARAARKVEKAAKAARQAKETTTPKEVERVVKMMVTENLHLMGIATGARNGDTKKPIAGRKQTQRAKIRAKEKAARTARAPAASKMGNRVLRAA